MIKNLLTSGILRVLYAFYKDALGPRLGETLFSQETLISVLFGTGIAVWGPHLFPDSAKLVDICLGFLSYAAIALGFCVGGVTIALTLPDRDFVVRLATLTIPTKKGDALSGLFFVFCWTAVVHWISIVLVLLFILIRGHDEGHVFEIASREGRTAIGITSCVGAYALMQFLITVLTLWQVGRSYIIKLQQDATKAVDHFEGI